MIAAIPPVSRQIAELLGGANPPWVFHAIGALAVAVVVIAIVLVIGLAGVYLERKIAGRMQNRSGPNRVGPYGLLQTVADGVKLVLKEDVVREGTDSLLFRFAPYIVFLAAFTGFCVLPFGPGLTPVDLDVGIFFYLGMIGVETIGIVMAGWSSNNKWSLLGSMREVAQVVSYEIPLGIAAMCPVLIAGTLSIEGMVDAQQGHILNWMLLKNGYYAIAMVPAFLIFYTSALAAAKRTPFDLPEAESELTAGFHTEYSGMRFGMFYVPEYAVMMSLSGIGVALFLGGYHDPFGLSAEGGALHGAWWWGLIWFFSKATILFLFQIFLRWTVPRLRIDQVMYLCYKVLLPLSLVCLIAVAALRLIG